MMTQKQFSRLLLVTVMLVWTAMAALQAQAPDKMSYQAVVRNSDGVLIANRNIGIRILILKKSEFGPAAYVETHTPSTNANGLVSLEIGSGTVIEGSFSAIDWSDGPYFLKTEIDPLGGTSYSIISTTQLLSVPFSLHAKTAEIAAGIRNLDIAALIARIDALEVSELLNNGFTDPRDGNHYNVVKIGNQVWMAENLKATRYNDGTDILFVDDDDWLNQTTGAYCWYNNDPAYGDIYGALYNWYAVSTGNLCPNGWHVPSDDEWTELTDYLGGLMVAGGKLKEAGTVHWQGPNEGATNETGFTALPGGSRYYTGAFTDIVQIGYWWSTTEEDTDNAWYRDMYYGGSGVGRHDFRKKNGFSVRCIRD